MAAALEPIGPEPQPVARALDIEFRESDKLKQEAIEKLAERIDQHLDHVSELFDKTWSRWHDCHFRRHCTSYWDVNGLLCSQLA
ncbi:hypothetical protein N598_25700 [Klebsiella pneumoniae 303K]|uniref:hypothetical protein n=1 Tax=Klebsiella pneumoniae TaxID=573 RepID=UPI0003B2C0F0|nr:hypothetical protein [Klebsiella pneumoniae]ERN56932.1 hypothetical protein N598_25700 [Klebsiella pneumoniae 303K]